MNAPHQISIKLPKFHRHPLFAISLVMVLSLLGCATARREPPRTANPADVDTIAHIIRADYECISGPAGMRGKVRQKPRDDTFYIPGALFASIEEENGRINSRILTQDQYWAGIGGAAGDKPVHAAYETEVGRRIERYGGVAQVRSVSVLRDTPDGPIKERYVNYSQLYWDGARWWITGMVWQKESAGTLIPESWIGKWEETTR